MPTRTRERLHRVEARDGQKLALTEVSAGPRRPPPGAPAFLLLHGFAQNRLSYSAGPLPYELLRRGARVFLAELRGHGDSHTDQIEPWSLETHLELDCPALLEGVRQRAGVERVHLMGHSMGGLLGCALLAREAPLASLTALASPILLGADRAIVRLASLFVGPLATIAPRGRRVPMDLFLRALAKPLSSSDAAAPLRLLQRWTGLASPAHAEPAALEAILASADRESPAVFEELARNAVLLRPRIAGVDLVAAVRNARLPIAAVVGTADIFAPRAALAPLEAPGQLGPRRILEVEGGTHIDVSIGHHVPDTVAQLWEFLLAAAAQGP
jgi:pimeloyl-ACP methyl ester carboxylesterase